MRFRLGSTWIYPLLLTVILAVGLLISGGCGGGGGTGNPNPTPTPSPTVSGSPTPTPSPTGVPVTVQTQIIWSPRSRATTTPTTNVVSGLSSALSAKINLTSGSTSLTYTVDRDQTQTGGYTGTYPSPSQINSGNYLLTVTFYAQPGAAGAVVGTAQANATVQNTGLLSMTIATNGRINSVTVQGVSVNGVTTAILPLGQTADVIYSAFDGVNGTGNLLAVTPGSGFAASANSSKITASGISVTGVAPTTGVNITVSVDNVTSPVFTVAVRSPATISVTPNSDSGTPVTVGVGLTQQFMTAVANDPTSSGVTYAVQEGAAGGTITAAGLYTAPSTLPGGTYHIVVTSVYDPNATKTITVNVTSLVSLQFLNPVSPMSILTQQQFTVQVTGDPTVNGGAATNNTGVTWSVQEGAAGGTITTSGVYSAPRTPGTYHIVATDVFDTSKTAVFAVTVLNQVTVTINSAAFTDPISGKAVTTTFTTSPKAVTVSINSTVTFTSTTVVPPNQDPSVTWAVSGGSIVSQSNATGATTATTTTGTGTLVYQAPNTPGTYTIKATSNFDTSKSDSATVTAQSGDINIIVK